MKDESIEITITITQSGWKHILELLKDDRSVQWRGLNNALSILIENTLPLAVTRQSEHALKREAPDSVAAFSLPEANLNVARDHIESGDVKETEYDEDEELEESDFEIYDEMDDFDDDFDDDYEDDYEADYEDDADDFDPEDHIYLISDDEDSPISEYIVENYGSIQNYRELADMADDLGFPDVDMLQSWLDD